MGWLERADRRNQHTSNWLMDYPEAGTKSFPFAKSPRARRILVGLAIATAVATLSFGIIGGLVGIVVTALVGRGLECNPVKDRYER